MVGQSLSKKYRFAVVFPVRVGALDFLFMRMATLGLTTKNAILIVQFAKARVDDGMELIEATREGARFEVASWEIDFFGRIRSLKARALEEYLATSSPVAARRFY